MWYGSDIMGFDWVLPVKSKVVKEWEIKYTSSEVLGVNLHGEFISAIIIINILFLQGEKGEVCLLQSVWVFTLVYIHMLLL